MQIRKSTILNHAETQFIRECKARGLEVSQDLAHYLIHLLARDGRLGINWNRYNVCRLEHFIESTLQMYADPMDPFINTCKLKFFFINFDNFHLKNVEKQYQQRYDEQLQQYVNKILRYPENVNEQQLKEMERDIIVYIIVAFSIGDPNCHVLSRKLQKCLEKILEPTDLHSYVVKKKYHRLEVLQRLSATVCGLLLSQNLDPAGEREYLRDVPKEIKEAKQKAEEVFEDALKTSAYYMEKSVDAIDNLLQLNFKTRTVQCNWPIEKVRQLNKYAVLFTLYGHLVEKLEVSYSRTKLIADTAEEKLECVISRIKDILKRRSDQDSDLIFINFKYLAELWRDQIVYLTHIRELINAKEEMDKYFNENIRQEFIGAIERIEERRKVLKGPTFIPFPEKSDNEKPAKGCDLTLLAPVSDHFKCFCCATISLTNGMLVASNVQKKLCADSPLMFGFRSYEHAKYGERYFATLDSNLLKTLGSTTSLIILFNLEETILQQDYHADDICQCVECECHKDTHHTQTELLAKEKLLPREKRHFPSNKWDFHRETIVLANMRKKQTHSQQTVKSYGQRVQKNQKFNMKHF